MTIDGFEDVPENDEAALKQAVAMQPVSVAICASGGLQFYSSGIVGGKCCDELDHGVLTVGYGVVRSSSGFNCSSFHLLELGCRVPGLESFLQCVVSLCVLQPMACLLFCILLHRWKDLPRVAWQRCMVLTQLAVDQKGCWFSCVEEQIETICVMQYEMSRPYRIVLMECRMR